MILFSFSLCHKKLCFNVEKLFKRRQFVKMQEYFLPHLDISRGVPQRSVLGPKLFIIYMNGIYKASTAFI